MRQGPAFDEYTLWLEPSGDTRERFKAAIEKFSHVAHTPIFTPHVTLLGGLKGNVADIEQQLVQLVQGQKQFTLSFTTCDAEATYHRAFYLCCESSHLEKLHQVTHTLFKAERPYYPHLSLVYGTLTKFEIAELHKLVEAENLPKEFLVNTVSLWHARGAPGEWVKISERPFVESV